jgi:hypothetical protein
MKREYYIGENQGSSSHLRISSNQSVQKRSIGGPVEDMNI